MHTADDFNIEFYFVEIENQANKNDAASAKFSGVDDPNGLRVIIATDESGWYQK